MSVVEMEFVRIQTVHIMGPGLITAMDARSTIPITVTVMVRLSMTATAVRSIIPTTATVMVRHPVPAITVAGAVTEEVIARRSSHA